MDKITFDYLMHKIDSRRGRRDYEDSRRGGHDYEDGRTYDSRDYDYDYEGIMDSEDEKVLSPRLSKNDMHNWKQIMENEDGTHGPHYDISQVMNAADKIGISFDEGHFDEKEFCMAMNMMYSDYCKIAKKYVSPDKELMFFAELAKAFLCDKDGPKPYEKLALYYNCIVDV